MMALLKLRPGLGVVRWLVACILSGLFALTASASGGAGDEVTSLPFAEDSSGVTFVGTVREIHALVVDLQGGQISVRRVPQGLMAVTLSGDYRLELDRAALARSNVRILFHGGDRYQGGYARLVIADSAPVMLSPERVPLPLDRLAAAARLLGNQLVLDVFGTRGQRAHVEASFSIDRVTLVQREL